MKSDNVEDSDMAQIGELDIVLMTLFSKRRPKLLSPEVLKQGEHCGYLATMSGRVVLTIHGEARARELFNREP